MAKTKDIVVKKFGGTSVASTDLIKAVAKRVIETHKKGKKIVVVVSAMGKTTDRLIKLANEISKNPHPREYDALVSTGENVSAALLAMALQDEGIPAVSLTGYQAGIKTESVHSKAKIKQVKPERILVELEAGNVVIIAGFQGITDNTDITTIGRGGSDTSAVVLAAVLGCDVCEIYTDVDGIYTTDPRKVEDARKLAEISYDEMLELASLGAKVLHPRSVEVAKENKIIIHVQSAFKNKKGTYVKEANTIENKKAVTGVTVTKGQAKITIVEVPDTPGVAGKIFTKLANSNINIDMIIQSTEKHGVNNISFTVNKEDLQEAKRVSKAVADELGAQGVRAGNTMAKVSIVGVGMISRPGIAARMFSALGENKINIDLISTSEIKVSCAIFEKDAIKALKVLHQEFELEKE